MRTSVAWRRAGDGLGGRRSFCVVVGTPDGAPGGRATRRDEAGDADREGEAEAGEEHGAWAALISEFHHFNSPPLGKFSHFWVTFI